MLKLLVKTVVLSVVLAAVVSPVLADQPFDNLIAQKKWKDAVEYADNNIPAPTRSNDVWVKLGQANEELGLTEKAMACYLVSTRLNPTHYESLLGAAKIYNKLEQPDQAMEYAKKALDQKFSGEASWEYARACIILKRPADAKKALEKVIETDPSNIVANRELGNIYFKDKQYDKAIPLLKKANAAAKGEPEIMLAIGQSYREMGVWDSAMVYIQNAVKAGLKRPEITLDLARIFFEKKNYPSSIDNYERSYGAPGFQPKDYYNAAVAKEKTNDAKGALELYSKAVNAYGNGKDNEAILAHLKVGDAAMDTKNYNDALNHFLFIADADKAGTLVPDINFLLADAYQALKDVPKAISSLEKAIAKSSKNVEAYARLADLYQKAGDAAKAKSTYETMMTLSPNDPNVYLVLGQYNLKAGKYNDALGMFAKSESLKPSAESEQGVAISAMALKQSPKAQESAKLAIKRNPDLIECRKILAATYMESKSYREAKEHLEYLVAKDQYNKDYWVQLAECYDGLNDSENLAKADRKLIDMDAKNAKSRLRLANYLLSKNNAGEAYDMFRNVIALEPKNTEALRNLYQIALKQGKKPEATSYLKQLLDINPNNAEDQKNLGDMLYEQNDFDGALASYRMAIKLDPTIKGFYKRYADIVIKKGQTEEVLKALSGLIESGDADASAYTTVGMIYEQQKQFKKALDTYQKALQKDPSNADLLASLGACQAANGDINSAVITYEQAVMMNPNASKEYKALGDLYIRQNKNDQAMKTYMGYLNKNPDDAEVAKKVGFYAFDRKMYPEAAKYLGMVKGKDADDPAYIQAYGEACFQAGKFDQAVALFENARKSNKQPSMKMMLMLGQAYEKLGKNVNAAEAYAEYVKLSGGRDPEACYKSAFMQETANPAAAQKIYEQNTNKFPADYRNFLRLGLMLTQKPATMPQAISMLKRVTALADTIPTVWLELGKVYGNLGKEDDELAAYKQYAKSDPQNVQANKRIGIILLKRNKVTEGMVYLETANAVAPDDPDVIGALADGYVKTNRKKEAIDMMVKVKNAKKDDPEIRFKLFQLFKETGKTKEAEKEISDLIALKRDNKYMAAYAQLMVEQGRSKDAENTIEDILATDPENISTLLLKAYVLRLQKRYDEAIEVYKEITGIEPNNPQALYERAETHMLQAKPQWAETFYQRALRANPSFGLAELGLAKLSKVRKDDAGYRDHLQKAKALEPTNKDIQDECAKAGIR